ncbi:MAG: FAD-dependent oxidoreductase, partial [Chromatiales bacterium]|nr:FAD-dependent oxidoreductase [Chromatiales bacterium]
AAAVKAKVTLVERHRMGGDCLNTGCVPSKTLIRTARLAHEARRAGEFGLAPLEPHVNFTAVMDRVRRVIAAIEPHDSVERYTELGVECRLGDARIVSPWCVEVDGEPISTRAIVIATGARPFVPPIRGLDEVPYFTSDTIWEMKEQPRRLTVLGGGPIGCELAQCFARFGTAVTIVEMADTVLVRDEPEMAATVAESLRADGVKLRVGARAQAVTPAPDGGGSILCTGDDGTESHVDFDAILVAVGRRPNVHGFGLEEIGINAAPEAGGVVETDDYLATLHPNIFACGDVAGPYQFTHAAAHQAWYAAVNALFGQFRQFAVDYRVIPRVTYTEPELASVGIGEAQARADGVEYEITRYGLDDLDRAIVDGEARGEVKVLTAPGSDRILGAHIVGAHAGELICAFTIAMRHKLGLKKILGTIHPYPTMMEANKYVAGVWQRDHAPAKLLEWLSRYHAWRRG